MMLAENALRFGSFRKKNLTLESTAQRSGFELLNISMKFRASKQNYLLLWIYRDSQARTRKNKKPTNQLRSHKMPPQHRIGVSHTNVFGGKKNIDMEKKKKI